MHKRDIDWWCMDTKCKKRCTCARYVGIKAVKNLYINDCIKYKWYIKAQEAGMDIQYELEGGGEYSGQIEDMERSIGKIISAYARLIRHLQKQDIISDEEIDIIVRGY